MLHPIFWWYHYHHDSLSQIWMVNKDFIRVWYILIVLTCDVLAQGNYYNPQQSQEIVMPNAGIVLIMFKLRQHHWLPVVQYICSTPQRLWRKNSSSGEPRWRWATENPGIKFNTSVLTLKCSLAIAINIFVVLFLLLWHR